MAGNLFASLLLPNPAAAARRPELSFVAALAVHDAVAQVRPAISRQLSIKWPNDVLLDGRKFAGILIEAGAEESVVIGIGINCVSHPGDTEYPATDLAAAGVALTADEAFEALSGTMRGRLDQWSRGEGFAAIRGDWLARAAGIGAEIRVRLSERTLAGRFEALDDAGRLMVRLPDDSLQVITAGDVFPLGPEQGSAQ